jgi:hypothetical protein
VGRQQSGRDEVPRVITGMLAVALTLSGCWIWDESPAVGGGTSQAESSGPSSSSTAGAGSDSSGEPLAQTPACADYLECLAEDEPALLPQAEGEYGPAGTCWSDPTTAAQCDATCTAETEARCLSGGDETTGGEPLLCSIEGLLPAARSPVQAGEGAGVLPLPVGALLERNCGCHYVDARLLSPEVPAYLGAMPMATWQDFHTPFMGTLTYLRVQQRAVVELGMPPPYFCDSLDLGSLSAEDHALLQAWLEAGAPDAARWGG